MDLELLTLGIGEIKEYERNARINVKAVDAVVKSIKKNGYIAPIVVDENHIILAGHTRLKALKKLGYKEVECVVKDGLTEAQKKAYRIADNKTGEIADWNFELLRQEVEELLNTEFDIDSIGFDENEIESIISQNIIEPQQFSPVYPSYQTQEATVGGTQNIYSNQPQQMQSSYDVPQPQGAQNKSFIDDLLENNFVDIVPRDEFAMTFEFPIKYKEAMYNLVKEKGKKEVTNIIISALLGETFD